MLAGTPTSGNSVSKCCFLAITQTSSDTFEMNFTAVSRRSHRPVAFTMRAKVDNDDVIGTWRLQGSKRMLGEFHQTHLFPRIACTVFTNAQSHSMPFRTLQASSNRCKVRLLLSNGRLRLQQHGHCSQ